MPPWVKGQTGNPGGRGKGPSFSTILRRQLAKVDRRNVSEMEKIGAAVIAKAKRGDIEAARWLADRVDGKVPQSISVDSQQTVTVVPWLPAGVPVQEALGEVVPELQGAEIVTTDNESG